MSDNAPTAPVKRDDALLRSVERLCDLEVEYDLTLRVLAVLVERVQDLTGGARIDIADAAIYDQPDLSAWRDAESGMICLSAGRAA